MPTPARQGERTHRVVPLWLKWFVGLLIAVLLLLAGEALLGADRAYLVPLWAGFLLLALFPGRDPSRPRLFFAVSVLWALLILITLAVLVQSVLHVEVIPLVLWDVLRTITLPLLVLEAGLCLALLVTLWKRMSVFRPLIAVATLLSVAAHILDYGNVERSGLGGPLLGLALGICLDIAVAFYLILYFRVRQAAPRRGDAVPVRPRGPGDLGPRRLG